MVFDPSLSLNVKIRHYLQGTNVPWTSAVNLYRVLRRFSTDLRLNLMFKVWTWPELSTYRMWTSREDSQWSCHRVLHCIQVLSISFHKEISNFYLSKPFLSLANTYLSQLERWLISWFFEKEGTADVIVFTCVWKIFLFEMHVNCSIEHYIQRVWVFNESGSSSRIFLPNVLFSIFHPRQSNENRICLVTFFYLHL